MGEEPFPSPRQKSKGVTYASLAFWNCAHHVTQTITARQLDVGIEVVAQYYARATEVMSADALRRQSSLVWGQPGTSKTTEVELDCSVFASWTDVNETGQKRWNHLVYMGARQRGPLERLFIKCLGIQNSTDGWQVDPESYEQMHAFMRECFGNQAEEEKPHLTRMTDGALAYT